ncbi:MAG TPA: heavy-metal-associated domain-containing protein [Croceibacterium sp.]|nr:heavy-metal-associated domain-containing protein [Croceibacterium sp.]
MASLSIPETPGNRRLPYLIVGALALALGGGLVVAQVLGDRGIPPVAASTDIEVHGIEVDVTGKNPEEARQNGWKLAQREAWKKLDGPAISDSQLQGLVSAVIVETERLSQRRYIATLGVVFDRARAGGLLGGGGERSRSAPMLTLPVLISGGTQTMFEVRNPWQRAWAEHQMGASAIDYVRPVGSGGESLLLTYGQTNRRSRAWWTGILDQFGAADVLIPIARLNYTYPGGPVEGHFTARHGPDSKYLGEFTLRVPTADQLPQMLKQAVQRFDSLFTTALAQGVLRPDPTLRLEDIELKPEVRALIEAARRAEELQAGASEQVPDESALAPDGSAAPTQSPADAAATVNTFTVQVATPDAASFDAALSAVRGAAGVRGASVSSTAIGGTSVLRVSFAGEIGDLAAALRARGWQVTQGSGALGISR